MIDRAQCEVAAAEEKYGLFAKFATEWAGRRKVWSYGGGLGQANEEDPGNYIWSRSLQVILLELPHDHVLQTARYGDEKRGDFLEAILYYESNHDDPGLRQYRKGIELVTRSVMQLMDAGWFECKISRLEFEYRYDLLRMHVIRQVHARKARDKRHANIVCKGVAALLISNCLSADVW